ncbi:hypothetical protein SADUNF_Sadunf01G0130600 [Salix dunnii]|uniref:Peptidase S8/S53 domain-containing protein n=1 Tax=Salix dunnii TaxID=1413687 RepID=A0A835NC30_9ROSI|nr:hypothetical protein SADUNF_Sadunf01G0130600 [Salix dunnii]
MGEIIHEGLKGYIAHKGRPNDESKESTSPRNTEGHGTHTTTNAPGSLVHNVRLFQYTTREARGMASKPKIAAYKNCWSSSCYDSDILVAMDQDIYDGFHVISLHVGATHAPQYDHDSIAIRAFSASKYGIVVSCSTRNVRPNPYTTINIAAWILIVGASTIDKSFRPMGNAVLLSQSIAKLVPTATKFALATTVYSLDNFDKNINDLASGEESTPFIHGGGHADPSNAHNMDTSDNISFLHAIICLMCKLRDHDLAFHFTKMSIWRLWNLIRLHLASLQLSYPLATSTKTRWGINEETTLH